MPDLDFLPAQRTGPDAAVPFTARPDTQGRGASFTARADATGAATLFAPRVDTVAAPRDVALPRFDVPSGTDPRAEAAGWAAGYAAGARQAAADAEREAEARRVEHERAEQVRAAEHAAALAALAHAADELRARRAPVLADAAGTLRAAALELATTLLGAELSDASAAARAAIDRVLRVEGLPDDVTVRLHPRDLGAAELPPETSVRLVADPTLAPGDAVAEYQDGHVDARLTAAVQRVRDALDES